METPVKMACGNDAMWLLRLGHKKDVASAGLCLLGHLCWEPNLHLWKSQVTWKGHGQRFWLTVSAKLLAGTSRCHQNSPIWGMYSKVHERGSRQFHFQLSVFHLRPQHCKVEACCSYTTCENSWPRKLCKIINNHCCFKSCVSENLPCSGR